jgi:hypothetical protein
MSKPTAATAAILAYTRRRKIQSPHIDEAPRHARPIDPLVEARAQVRALEVKVGRLSDELFRLKREKHRAQHP